MKISEFAPVIFPGIDPGADLKQAAVVVKERTDAMTFRIDGNIVETLNGQAKQAIASVKDASADTQKAFIYALILSAEEIGRKVVLRVREDGGRIQLGKM